MAAAGVFVLRDDRTLAPLQSAEFARESDFQALVGDFPELLAGEQMNAASPRRFLLVDREVGIPASTGGDGRWPVDHVFLDQDGVPTLVEIKRQSDVRLRREVIGQLMEYAANAVAYLAPESLQASFEARCLVQELDAGAELVRHLGEDGNAESFWRAAADNLRAGRVRLVLVADLIAPELRTIVEFMNRQMQPAEVLAVELRQYQGEGLRALAPLVIGQSQEIAQRRRGTGPAATWTPETILEALTADETSHAAASAIVAWMQAQADGVNLTSSGAMGPKVQKDGAWLYPFLLSRRGEVTFFFDYLADKPVYAPHARRRAWADDLAAAGLPIDPREVDGRQSVALGAFSPEITAAFLRAMDGFVERLRSS